MTVFSEFGSRRHGGNLKGKAARAYLDGFGTVKSGLELDTRLNPWKRGYHAAIRSAMGH